MMAINKKVLEQEPGDIEALLPWHAAGTLSARDTRRVEDALARDPSLAKQYAVIQEEYAETIALNESLGAPSARAMQKLFAAIDAEPARKPSASLNFSTRIAEFFAGLSPRTLAYAAALGALALLLQAGVIGAILAKAAGRNVSDRVAVRSEGDHHPLARTGNRLRAPLSGSRRMRACPTSRRSSMPTRRLSSTAPRAACSACSSATSRCRGRKSPA